jgi:hypothetical protein
MLAVCQETVSLQVRAIVAQFWRECEAWLEGVMLRGIAEGVLAPNLDVGQAARTWIAALEGSMVTGRVFADSSRVMATFDFLLRQVTQSHDSSKTGRDGT